jgi:mono/diheme cytochrome c family protein
MRRVVWVAGLALVALACGDPDTEDARGYTKAPLEEPGLLVAGEVATPMDALGRPDRPRVEAEREAIAGEDEGAGSGGADAGGEAAQVTLAPGVSQEQFDLGRELFTGQGGCQACHGPDAGGSQLAPDLTDAEWLHVAGPDPEAIAGVIRDGVAEPAQYPAPMPPMGGASLTDDQVQALAAYLASIGQG